MVTYPRVSTDNRGKLFLTFYRDGKRIRTYTGSIIDSPLNPNSHPSDTRESIAHALASEIYLYCLKGGVLKTKDRGGQVCNGSITKDLEFLSHALRNKQRENHSEKYMKLLCYAYSLIEQCAVDGVVEGDKIRSLLGKYTSNTSYNTLLRHMRVLCNEAINLGMTNNPLQGITVKRGNAVLHKPIGDVVSLLSSIEKYNPNLHLCCLLAYGCLLRPHREIRELTWKEFDDNLNFISLGGERNKSGRNRVVPIPSYLKNYLVKGDSDLNIFTNTPTPPNPHYFSTLWSRYKKKHPEVGQYATLYSFRHTGALSVYNKTKSIHVLKDVMGHASLEVSMIYLRGLTIASLTEDVMPSL